MRYLKSLIIAAFAFAMAAGTLLAADDPLEIHGGGRVGIVVNSKLGGRSPAIGNNALGTMPNYGQSQYFGLSFSKKVTAEGGAWAKVNYSIDNSSLANLDADCTSFTPRTRGVYVEFGGLDFLPAGATLWGGLRGYGAGWNGQQDHTFINLAGVGLGVQNIGGVFSVAYFKQGFGQNNLDKLGSRDTHHFVANINMPMLDLFGSFGYAKKAGDQTVVTPVAVDTTLAVIIGYDADGNPIYDAAGPGITPESTSTVKEKNLTEFYVGGIYHAPVYGINIGLSVATNGYAREIYGNDYDTFFKGHASANTSGSEASIKAMKAMGVRALVWTVTDLAPGLYTATSIRYDMLKDKNPAGKNTLNKFDASIRLSKSLTKNIAFVPTLGIERQWDKEKAVNAKPLLIVDRKSVV